LSIQTKKAIACKLMWLIVPALFVFAVSISLLYAATQGPLGETSEGSAPLELEVPRLVKISNIADIEFGVYGGAGDLAANHNVCIWTNDSEAKYVVTASGDGEDAAFTLASDTGTLPYSLFWNDSNGTAGNEELVATEVSGAMENANTSAFDCGEINNANFEVRISQDNLLSSRPGVYTGVLTLVIAPPLP